MNIGMSRMGDLWSSLETCLAGGGGSGSRRDGVGCESAVGAEPGDEGDVGVVEPGEMETSGGTFALVDAASPSGVIGSEFAGWIVIFFSLMLS